MRERLLIGLTLAAALTLSAQLIQAGVSAAATKHGHHKHRRVRTRTVVRTVTVTAPAPAAVGGELAGTFKVTAGSYANGAAHGSWFRMILPGGSAARGPYFANPDSTASDHNYTLLSPGSDGGLISGGFQAPPSPAFDDNGNALAARIIRPQRFAGVDFSVSTAPKDAQTGATVQAPSLTAAGGKLTGDLRAFTAEWNKQYFNQGSPKPDGSRPGITTPVSGTYDVATRAFTLEWTSSIVGGPFNGFTGQWHLEGTFVSCSVG